MNDVEKKEEVKTEEQKYKKEALMNSNKYAEYYDILSAILEDDQEYTISDVERRIKNFMKKEVK